jgi:phospholipid/cholesterol/gamma-HCH transport system substrate-binding protein
MPAKPFKFRHVNEIAGAFAVTVVLLLLGLVFISGHLQGWFERKRIVQVVLPENGTFGVRQGSEVRILGARAGTVKSVELRHRTTGKPAGIRDIDPKELQLVAVLELRGAYTVFVGKESKVFLKTGLGGLGAAYLEVSRGDTPDPQRTVLEMADLSANMQKDMTDVVSEIRDAMVPAINQIQATSAQIEVLAETLSNPDKDFQLAMTGVRKLVDEVNKGESVAGVLLRDERTGADIREALAKFREASTSFSAVMSSVEKGEGAAGMLLTDKAAQQQLTDTLANVARASEAANKAVALLTEVAESLPDTVNATDAAIADYATVADSLDEASREYEIVAEALQRHWLLRKFVRREENPVAVPRDKQSPVQSEVSVDGRSRGTPALPSQSGVPSSGESKLTIRGLFGGNKGKESPPAPPAGSAEKPVREEEKPPSGRKGAPGAGWMRR